MATLTISKILELAGLDVTKRIKLVRHKASNDTQEIDGKPAEGNPYDWYVNDRQKFIAYQSEQREDRFKDVDYIISFIGEEGTIARMVGVYEVLGYDEERANRVNTGKFYYKMKWVEGFDEFNERVIINWGKSALSWHQWLHKNDKEVIAIERKGIDWVCPNYEEIKLPYAQLARIVEDNIDIWRHKLTACNCIYVISDSMTGKLYVGSTYNREGIWGRWKDYAKTGHGNDVELMRILETDPNYAKDNFTWSILQVLPFGISENEAVRIETLWKNKLGREACKLNKN